MEIKNCDIDNIEEMPVAYKEALKSFVGKVAEFNPTSIVLFGGFGRAMPKINWSDVDILLVYKKLSSDLFRKISDIRKNINTEYAIHLDINILSEGEIKQRQLLSVKYSSKHSNILSGRPGSVCIYGKIEPFNNVHEEEKIANIFKVNEATYQFRKCFIKGNYLHFETEDIKEYIKKTFSTVRASLVIMDDYVHPYEALTDRIKELFPDYNVELLLKLIDIRNGAIDLNDVNKSELFIEMFDFLDNYVSFISPHFERKGLL